MIDKTQQTESKHVCRAHDTCLFFDEQNKILCDLEYCMKYDEEGNCIKYLCSRYIDENTIAFATVEKKRRRNVTITDVSMVGILPRISIIKDQSGREYFVACWNGRPLAVEPTYKWRSFLNQVRKAPDFFLLTRSKTVIDAIKMSLLWL